MLIKLATPLASRFWKWLKAKMGHTSLLEVFFPCVKHHFRQFYKAYSKLEMSYVRYYVRRVHSQTVKPHYVWPEETRWDYLNAIVLHLEYSREFNQILKQSMHQLRWTLSLPLEPKECSEKIPPAKKSHFGYIIIVNEINLPSSAYWDI